MGGLVLLKGNCWVFFEDFQWDSVYKPSLGKVLGKWRVSLEKG